MPGKYSHSVVLADYSSRGIINLPTDQHIKYVNSSPQAPGRSSSQARARGTRSAQAVYVSPPDSASWRASTASRPHPSLIANIANTAPGRTRLELPEEDESNAFQPMRYSQYYRQMPNSSPNINTTSLTNAQEAPPVPGLPSKPMVLSAYQRQQLLNASNRLDHDQMMDQQGAVGRGVDNLDGQIEEDPWSLTAVPRYVKSTSNFRRGASDATEADTHVGRQHRTDTRSSQNEQVTQQATEVSKPRAEQQPSRSIQRLSDPPPYDEAQRNRNVPKSSTSSHGYKRSEQYQRDGHDMRTSTPVRNIIQPDRNEASSSSNPRIRTPQSNRDSTFGPDFNAFLDREARNGTSNKDGDIRSPGPIHGDRDIPAVKPSTASVRTNSTRDTSTRVANNATTATSKDHRATSSISNANAANNSTSASAASTSSPSKKATSIPLSDRQAQMDRQSWQLPEIKEDQDFTPSIFEARLSHDEANNVTRDDIERSIGQISSGKDVTYDDAASELSAALPPPISRFRDDEDEFNSNMAKLFGEGGDQAITKKGSHTLGRSFKKRGFFAKFRNKS